jgi:hypothetical protein
MEVEVNSLMGVADEALWHSEGLFTSTDELSRCVRINSSLQGAPRLTSSLLSTSLVSPPESSVTFVDPPIRHLTPPQCLPSPYFPKSSICHTSPQKHTLKFTPASHLSLNTSHIYGTPSDAAYTLPTDPTSYLCGENSDVLQDFVGATGGPRVKGALHMGGQKACTQTLAC